MDAANQAPPAKSKTQWEIGGAWWSGLPAGNVGCRADVSCSGREEMPPRRDMGTSVILMGNLQEPRMRKRLLAAIAIASFGAIAFAQSTAGLAGISGIVRDASGAAVPNARIAITNESKGVVRK